ncbi:elongator complex protein 2 isoform X2 [Tachypleus tridentatus]|uniref:elongator complex protein 2 isoform X2 n=1 Tax=Tachypleus tridentatus TaxID=6853 RepID=UPI003FD16FE2
MNMEFVVEVEHVSSSCNRCSNSLDWGRNGLICYGSGSSIVLLNPRKSFSSTTGQPIQTAAIHTNQVTSVRWIQHDQEFYVLSTSVDKTAMLSKLKDHTLQCEVIFSGHSSVVSTADAVWLPGDPEILFVVTTSADSTMKIWKRTEQTEPDCLQTVSFGNAFALNVKLTLLPGTTAPLLAVARDTGQIQLFVQDSKELFSCVHSLIGHEDWVRGLDFCIDEMGDLLLSSCSQDCFLRIWRVSPRQPGFQDVSSSNTVHAIQEIKLKENLLWAYSAGKEYLFAVSLESVLTGHEDWVYSVHWQLPQQAEDRTFQPMRLLSSSMDKTMILWEPDEESGVWLEKVRVGEVGGNTLGFYGGVFSPDGNSILAHGYHGAFHLWHYNSESDSWDPGVVWGGHFSAVQDLVWDPEGEYLLSCSSDQTTRLHGPWVQESGELSWYEIARPQVHGYDLSCIAVVNRYKFVSGADEKVLRILEAPRNFLENFYQICNVDVSADTCTELSNLPKGANVPSLGLSNKAVFEQDLITSTNQEKKHPKDQYPDSYFTPLSLKAPPSEEHLLQNTLWPEVQKLYGHGFEVFAVACSHTGTIIASACKANKPEHACIILWNTLTWKQQGQLYSHSLTVTQLAFSPNDQYLLAVSRDRTWSLFEQKLDKIGTVYERVAYSDKKTGIHGRIIWGCAWSHDGLFFATASRDKKVILWGEKTDKEQQKSCLGRFGTRSSVLGLEDAVTAVDFCPVSIQNSRYLLAVGLDSGLIYLYKWCGHQGGDQWLCVTKLDKCMGHHSTVKRLKFSPKLGKAGCRGKTGTDQDVVQLASCSTDDTVKVYNVKLSAL